MLPAGRIARIALRAMLAEVWVTPKPGLVDRSGRSGHRDMGLCTFLRSSVALYGYFRVLARRAATPACRPERSEAVNGLRRLGLAAEARMTWATGGVNTQKGIIFLGGLAVLGWRDHERSGGQLSDCIAVWARALVGAPRGAEPAAAAPTHGAAVRARHGVAGVIGEACAGLPTVFGAVLPTWYAARRAGLRRDLAGTLALLAAVAVCEDTTVLHRHGPAGLAGAQGAARAVLADWPRRSPGELWRQFDALDARWSAAAISPGGAADLLCVAFLVAGLCRERARRS